MKRILLFILQSIANYFIHFVIGLIIIWLGIPTFLPSLRKYSWDLLADLFSVKINLGIIIITIIGLVILYFFLQKFILRTSRFMEYGGLLWKVDKKTSQVGDIPYCSKHRAKLVERYIPHEEYPYSVFYCPMCGKGSKPKINSYDIDTVHSEAESVIHSKYGK